MGLRDRDYTQTDYSSRKKRRPRRTDGRSATGMIIFINVALWFANGLFFAGDRLTHLLLLRVGDISLLSSYRFLTYGFVHSPGEVWHILLNLFALLMFGYGMMLGIGPGGFGFVRSANVESRLGRLEFTAFYLLTIIVGGIVYALINANEPQAKVFGASGGVCGVVILFAWLYPRKILLLWGILPIPMWAIGILIVVMDAWGAAGYSSGNIAFSVHLAGAACGTLYYFFFLGQKIKLTGWLDASSFPNAPRKPKLRIHTPEDLPSDSLTDEEFNRLLDEVLKRYGEVGEAGLTPEEREFLQRASRKFSGKHQK